VLYARTVKTGSGATAVPLAAITCLVRRHCNVVPAMPRTGQPGRPAHVTTELTTQAA
jgi:hypothetical protein